eukprot:8428221-Pyramimonas_sp.AAC.1
MAASYSWDQKAISFFNAWTGISVPEQTVPIDHGVSDDASESRTEIRARTCAGRRAACFRAMVSASRSWPGTPKVAGDGKTTPGCRAKRCYLRADLARLWILGRRALGRQPKRPTGNTYLVLLVPRGRFPGRGG